jgi:hypothetical protein
VGAEKASGSKLSGIDGDPFNLSKVEEQLKRPPAGGELISVEVKAVVPKPSDGLIMAVFPWRTAIGCLSWNEWIAIQACFSERTCNGKEHNLPLVR